LKHHHNKNQQGISLSVHSSLFDYRSSQESRRNIEMQQKGQLHY